MSISKHSYGLGNKSFINTAALNLNNQSGVEFPDYNMLPPETQEEQKLGMTPDQTISHGGSARIAVTTALGKFGSPNEKKLRRREQQTQLKIQQDSKEQRQQKGVKHTQIK